MQRGSRRSGRRSRGKQSPRLILLAAAVFVVLLLANALRPALRADDIPNFTPTVTVFLPLLLRGHPSTATFTVSTMTMT